MPLSADQQAMLQLVLERGQSYDDLAGVLGVGVDEVRVRARAAIRDLGGEDPDAQVGLTDYLLGQADPIGRADAARQIQNDPNTNRLASELVARLREIAPDAKLPEIPAAKEKRRVAPARQPSEPKPKPEGSGLSSGQQRGVIIAGAAAILVIVVVLGIAGVFGGDGNDSGSGSGTTTEASADASADDVLAEVPLKSQGGSDATGTATFGIASGNQPYLEVELSELSAPQAESSYVVWLLLDEEQGYPLSPIDVGGDEFSDRITIPQFAIPLASRARFVDISLSQNKTLLSDLRKAVQDRKPILPYQGQSVLRGKIPAQARGASGGG